MIGAHQIPSAVVQAAEREYFAKKNPRMSMRDAIVAAINAWPDKKATAYFARGYLVEGVVLPLPLEKVDGEQ